MTVLLPGRSFESVFNASGMQDLVAQYGDWFSYDGSPRAQIFQRNQSLVQDVGSMIQLMRCVGDSEPGFSGSRPHRKPGGQQGRVTVCNSWPSSAVTSLSASPLPPAWYP